MVHSVKRPKGNLRRIESTDALKDEIVVPRGTLVTCIAGIKLQSEDVGAAIQFLEFCRSFGKVIMEIKYYVLFIISCCIEPLMHPLISKSGLC